MNTINYRFNPGDYVYGVHFYPSGAKIFKGEIIEMFSRVTKDYTFLGYKLSAWPVSYFPEENIFSSEDEAKKAREDWLNNIKDKQHEEDFNTPSMLPYDSDSSSSTTTTQRISAFRRRNS
jgi:hypothetical protein